MHPLKAKRKELWANWKTGEVSREEFKKEIYHLCFGKYKNITTFDTTGSQ